MARKSAATTSVTPPLILASASPRRQKLLRDAGFEFQTVAPQIDEKEEDVALTLRELTGWNALRKGLWGARRHPDAVVLAADTLVSLDHRVLSKPRDLAEAKKFLRRLSGRTHQVSTTVFIADWKMRRAVLFTETSDVRFKPLTQRQIDDYVSKINPLDKAGAYAAQGHGRIIIAKVTGSFSNVVGLPMEATISALEEFGMRPNESRPVRARRGLSRRAGPASKSDTKTRR